MLRGLEDASVWVVHGAVKISFCWEERIGESVLFDHLAGDDPKDLGPHFADSVLRA